MIIGKGHRDIVRVKELPHLQIGVGVLFQPGIHPLHKAQSGHLVPGPVSHSGDHPAQAGVGVHPALPRHSWIGQGPFAALAGDQPHLLQRGQHIPQSVAAHAQPPGQMVLAGQLERLVAVVTADEVNERHLGLKGQFRAVYG